MTLRAVHSQQTWRHMMQSRGGSSGGISSAMVPHASKGRAALFDRDRVPSLSTVAKVAALAMILSFSYYQYWLQMIRSKTVLCTTANDQRHSHVEINNFRVLSGEPLSSERDPMIPGIIHQTYKLSPMEHPSEFPDATLLQKRWSDQAESLGWKYKFWSDSDARNYLAQYFNKEVVSAYDALAAPAFKADLFRYCLLYREGGIYADIDVELVAELDSIFPPDVGFAVPAQTENPPPCGAWNGLTASTPGHPYLLQSIRHAVLSIRKRSSSDDLKPTGCWEYDLNRHLFNHLYLTGPNLLGASISRLSFNETCKKFIPGKYNFPGLPGRTVFFNRIGSKFFDHTDRILFASPPMPDLDKAKKSSGSSYDKMWKKGKVYND